MALPAKRVEASSLQSVEDAVVDCEKEITQQLTTKLTKNTTPKCDKKRLRISCTSHERAANKEYNVGRSCEQGV